MPNVEKRRLQDDCHNQTDLKRSRRDHARDQKSHLDRLPEELVVLILDRLDEGLIRSCGLDQHARSRHFKAFHSLCLTSRKLNRFAKTYLYATIISQPRDTIRQNLNFQQIYAPIDRLVLDAKVADGIKRISWVQSTDNPSTCYQNAITAVKLKFYRKLGELGIPELAGELRHSFHGVESKDHLAAILVLTRNLEYLEVVAKFPYYNQRHETWLELLQLSTSSSAPGLVGHFRHLYHVRFNTRNLNIEQIGPLLRLPSLRILSIENVAQYEENVSNDWDQVFGKQCSSIETLLMKNSRIGTDTVAKILAAIRKLKVLKLEFSSLSRTRSDAWLFGAIPAIPNWTTLSEALLAHKGSLEQVYIINRRWEASKRDLNSYNYLEGEGLLSGVSNLHSLRYLDTGLTPFCKITESDLSEAVDFPDMLPASLEHLVISVEGFPQLFDLQEGSLQKALLKLARACGLRTPSLKGIVIWLPHDRNELCALDFAACKPAFERLGIDLKIMCCYDYEWQIYPFDKAAVPRRSGGLTMRKISLMQPSLRRIGDWRPPYGFQGACEAYHHPDEWSIIDSLRK